MGIVNKVKKLLLLFLTFISLSFAAGAKYLIITHDNFYNAIQPLAQWKQKKGVPTKVVSLTQIGASGPSDITTIKSYIVNACTSSAWNPHPSYILLVGGPTYINSNLSKYDDYFGDISGDFKMEISVGRFPCENVTQCSLHVAKTLGYERTPYMTDQNWFKKGTTIVLEDYNTYPPTGQPDTVYWNDVRYVHGRWQNAGYTYIDSFSKAIGHTSTNVINAINDGRVFIFFRGQSTTNWWSPFTLDPTLTSNGFKLPVLVSATCATMTLSSNNYLGDRVLNAGTPQNPKGTVAFFGTTVVASGTGLARLRGLVGTGFYNAIFKENIYRLGDAARRGKFYVDSLHAHPHVQAYDSIVRYREWNLLGDPELNLWTTTPLQLTVIHDTLIYAGGQTYTVTVRKGVSPLPNALVCVMMDTIIYQYNTTNSSGIVSFSIAPPVGTMSVTVTAQNCIPYEKNVTAQPGGLVHDVSVYSIIEPIGTIGSGTNVIPKVKIKNYGSLTDTFPVTFKIGSIYTQTITQVILATGDTVTKSFPSWTAVSGIYSTKAYTSLASDQWRGNDTAFGSVNVLLSNDVGIDVILSPESTHALNTLMIPQARVKNYGALAQSNFSAICSIVSVTGVFRYTNTQTISLGVGGDTIINFGSWTPTITEICSVKIRTTLVGDANSANDRKTQMTNIVPISQVVIGTAVTNSYYGPMDRYYNYSTHEAIYLQSEIDCAGDITHIAYYKESGSDINLIENVTIYMKYTSSTTLSTGTYSLSGYTQVGNGSFTNNATQGWMEIQLDNPFNYNNTDNLQILIIKGYQVWINDYPLWRYTTSSPNYRTRQSSDDNGQPTNLTQTYNRPNIQITMIVHPPPASDVGVIAILEPKDIICQGQTITPKAIIKNFGGYTEIFSATFKIGTEYTQIVSSISLNPGITDTIDFPGWVSGTGSYDTKCYTQLVGDNNPSNDTGTGSVISRQSYQESFESSNGNCAASPSSTAWEWGVPSSGPGSAHSGTKLWATVLAGNYPNYANWTLTSSEFIATSNNPQLKFWHWYNMEESGMYPGVAYDGGNVKISTDSGATWTLIKPVGGYNGRGASGNSGIPNESCYTGIHETWNEAVFNLTVVSGQRVLVRWHFGSDGGVVRSGWYLDDITTTNLVTRFANDIGCVSIQTPVSSVDSGAVINPVAVIHNYSLNRATLDVKFDINDGYTATRSVSAPANSDTLISFTTWTARYFGTFTTKCSTRFTSDEDHSNDKTTGTVRVRFHDVGAYRIVTPRDSQVAGNLAVSAKIKNFYTRIASCSTRFIIRNTGGSIVFNQAQFVSGLTPNDTASVSFGNYNASPGKYYTTVFTKLATDDNAANDTLADSVYVVLAAPVLSSPNPSQVLTFSIPLFDWQDVTGASQYQIQVDNDNNFNSPNIDLSVTPSQLQVSSPGLTNDTYYWRVRAGTPYGVWSEIREFTIISSNPSEPGWTQKSSINTGIIGKYVKDGGALVAVGTNLYAFRGYKSNEFYLYNGTNWTAQESIPFGRKPFDPSQYNKKKVGKGGALCYDGAGKIYATKGNSTREFWVYNIASNSWTAKAYVLPDKGLKGGTGLVFNNGKVYLLAGGRKLGEQNFFIYDTTTNIWNSLSTPPSADGKAYKDGSCIVLVSDTIFALKGSGKANYFSAYNISTNAWSSRMFIPLIDSRIGREKKVKDGGAMTTDGSIVFAIKGGGVNEFWTYLPGTNIWLPLDTIRRLHKKSVTKTGAALSYADGKVYLLKGNNTSEFWQYTPLANITAVNPITYTSVMTENSVPLSVNREPLFMVSPNPLTKLSLIYYTVPVAGKVIIKLYNPTGRLIETIIDEHQNVGSYTLKIENWKLKIAKGIYFLKYEDMNSKKEIKIIKI